MKYPVQLVLTALNSSKSAYASFTCDRHIFFERYQLQTSRIKDQQSGEDRGNHFICQLYNKV